MRSLLLLLVIIFSDLSLLTAGFNSNFDYSSYDLEEGGIEDQDFARAIKTRIEKPWDVTQLPGVEELQSSHWMVVKYAGKILKAAKREKHFTSGTEIAFIKRQEAEQVAGWQKKLLHAQAAIFETFPNLCSLRDGSTQNIDRIRNAHAFREIIKLKNAENVLGIPEKKLIRLDAARLFADNNCVIIADEVEGQEPVGLQPNEAAILHDIIEEAGFNDPGIGNFIRNPDNKLMLIDTEGLLDGWEEVVCEKLKPLVPYVHWKFDQAKRTQGQLILFTQLLSQRSSNSDTQNAYNRLRLKTGLSALKHGLLFAAEPCVLACSLVAGYCLL